MLFLTSIILKYCFIAGFKALFSLWFVCSMLISRTFWNSFKLCDFDLVTNLLCDVIYTSWLKQLINKNKKTPICAVFLYGVVPTFFCEFLEKYSYCQIVICLICVKAQHSNFNFHFNSNFNLAEEFLSALVISLTLHFHCSSLLW